VAVGALEARIARRLPRLHPAEERVKGAIQAGEHILQDLRVDVTVLRAHVLDGRQLSALAGGGDAHPTLLPGVAALLEAGVVEFAATAHDNRQRALLLGSGYQFVRVGLAHRLLVHSSLVCRIGMKTARPFIPWLKPRGFLASSCNA